jgi:hypothetical protein
MRRYLLILVAAAACRVPDKQPLSGDAGPDASGPDAPSGPIDTMITSAPPDFSNSGNATFEFTSNVAGASFRCAIDGDMPERCMSPYTKNLPDGSHTFSVRASDGEGREDDSPAERVWTIDTVAPDTTITAGPPPADNSTMVMFFFQSNEMNVTFDCSLDSGDYQPCMSGDSFGPIGDGAHSFAVRAHDRAGNVDASPAIRAWITDTSTPDTEITGGPMNTSGSTSATFTFDSPDAGAGASFECSLDSPVFLPCSSPDTLSNLTEGSHTFSVRVRDAVGNVDPSPATRTWTVDLTPPNTMITSGPTGTVSATAAAFSFTSNEMNVTFTCSLDGGAMMPCTSPFSAMSMGQGPHTFAVAATDAAGHTDAMPATRTWTVDTQPPAIQITSGPNGTSGPHVTFAFTVSEGTPSCAVDTAAPAPYTSPVSLNLPAGQHTFSVRATDAAGNQGSSVRTWTVNPPDATGAAGLLHLDTGDQSQANAVASGQPATLGDTANPEATDPTHIGQARFGGGFSFDAAQSQKISWLAMLGATTAFTFEVWSNPDASSGPRDIVVSGDGRAGLRVLPISATQARFVITVANQTLLSNPVAIGQWHHVLASFSEPSLRLWVDGVRTEADNVSLAGMPVSLDSIIIGGTYGGSLDEVWIAQSAITDDNAALDRYCPL